MESMPILTYAIMAITGITSFMAFSNSSLKSRLLFHPHTIKRQGQWDRFLGHGFIHSGWAHLIFNMVTMYFFGKNVEIAFKAFFGQTMGSVHFLLLYFLGMILASVYSYFKHQDNPGYAALGASGAVSAALFASILIYPGSSLMIFPLPIPIPAIIFGPLYLAYSVYMKYCFAAFTTLGDNHKVVVMVGMAIKAKAVSIKLSIALNEVVAPITILAM